ncbi:UNKNOWN [Stylonychia lemnae]|uniref:Uncharacterized protein n=1 Tax=Stylonychia lemnae TaxID=5949 RepID=A0A078AW52_STYLE|nr:UNKNOWN [Stylonychia lemnae]|eukprot:CDW86374.1 UNKNOWN [Stylonychia lemnae]
MNDQMARNAQIRRNDWINTVQNNPDFSQSKIRKFILIFLAYQHGSILTKHPSLYEFRAKSDKANICNKKYETTVLRAKRLESEHKEAILEKLEYRQDDPLRKYFYRSRQNLNEIQPPVMRYQPRDKMERIKQTIDTNHRVNLEQLNNKMLHFPVFNEDERSKWLTKNGISMDGFKVEKTALWKEIDNNNEAGQMPFQGGLQEIADKLTIRPRMIHKEISQNPFSSVIAKDPWRNKLIQSNSLRSMKTIRASLDCLKQKNNVTFTLPELKIPSSNKGQTQSNDVSLSKSSDGAKNQFFTQSNQNFFIGGAPKVDVSKLKPENNNKNEQETDRSIRTDQLETNTVIQKDTPERKNIHTQSSKKKLKVLKAHRKIVDMGEGYNHTNKNNLHQTQQIKQIFTEWQDNPHLNIQNNDISAFNESYNRNHSTKIEKLTDQHFNKKIYDQKLYFQSAQQKVAREKTHIYEQEKTFDSIKKMQNTFNITDNMFSQSSPSVREYNLKSKRMSVEDLKSEMQKQHLHEYLSQSLIKKTKLTDLANESLSNNNQNQNETTNMTSNISKSNVMRPSQSYKILPGVSPITKDMQSEDNSVLIKLDKTNSNDYSQIRSPNNRYNVMAKLQKPKHLQSTAQLGLNNHNSTNSLIEEKPLDLYKRKKAVAQMLDHFFK